MLRALVRADRVGPSPILVANWPAAASFGTRKPFADQIAKIFQLQSITPCSIPLIASLPCSLVRRAEVSPVSPPPRIDIAWEILGNLLMAKFIVPP